MALPTSLLLPADWSTGRCKRSFIYLPLIVTQAGTTTYLPLIAQNATLGNEPTTTPSPTATPLPAYANPPHQRPHQRQCRLRLLPPHRLSAPRRLLPPLSGRRLASQVDAHFTQLLPARQLKWLSHRLLAFRCADKSFSNFRLFEDGYIAFSCNRVGE